MSLIIKAARKDPRSTNTGMRSFNLPGRCGS
jgi:hypothetical protein